MNPVIMAWLAEVGIITWRSVKSDSRPPLPSELLATFIAFGSLSLLANSANFEKSANLIAGGLVLATFLKLIDPKTGKPKGSGNAPSAASVVPQNPKG